MKVVIVGASGNVGTALLCELQRRSDDELVGISRRQPPGVAPYDGVRWHTLDVAAHDATSALTQIFDGADCVINLAWGFQPGRNTAYLDQVGVGGTSAILRAAAAAEVTHLIQMSSVGAYSPAPRGRTVAEDWPTGGVATSAYSREKASVEEILDAHVAGGDAPLVCRFRPGLIMQRAAGSALLRYGMPGWLPAAVLDLIPLLPLDRSFAVPVVHTADVAAAIATAIEEVSVGAFNLAAPTPLTPGIIAGVLRARPVHLPWKVLRALISLSWSLRVQRLDPGWIDLAFAVPLLDCSRAQHELKWTPGRDAPAVLQEAVIGMRSHLSADSATLRNRTVLAEWWDALRHGPITRRLMP